MSESSYTEPEDSTPSRSSAAATPPPPLKSPSQPPQPQQQPQGSEAAPPVAAEAASPAAERRSAPLDAAAYAAVDTTGNSMLHRLEYLHAVQEIARCDVERCIGQYGLSAVLNRYPLEPRTGAKARPRYLHATQTHRAQPAAAAAPQATSSFAPPTVPRGGRRPLTVQANFTGSTTVRGVGGGGGVGAATSDPAVAALLREQKQGNALLRKMLQQTQKQQQPSPPPQAQPSDPQAAQTPQAQDLLLHTQSSHATLPQDAGTDAAATLRRQLVDRIESLRQLAGEEKQRETEAAAAAVVAAADGRPTSRRRRPDAAAAGAPAPAAAGVKVTRQARRRRSLQSRAAAGTAVRRASASDTTAASPSPRGRQQQGGGGGGGGGGGAAGSMFGLPVAVEAAIMASMQGRPRTTTHETATSPLVRSLSALQGGAGAGAGAGAPVTTASGTSPLYRGVDTGVQPEGTGFGTPPAPQVASACTSPHVPFLLPGDAGAQEQQRQMQQREAAAAAFGAQRAARYEDDETEEEEESETQTQASSSHMTSDSQGTFSSVYEYNQKIDQVLMRAKQMDNEANAAWDSTAHEIQELLRRTRIRGTASAAAAAAAAAPMDATVAAPVRVAARRPTVPLAAASNGLADTMPSVYIAPPQTTTEGQGSLNSTLMEAADACPAPAGSSEARQRSAAAAVPGVAVPLPAKLVDGVREYKSDYAMWKTANNVTEKLVTFVNTSTNELFEEVCRESAAELAGVVDSITNRVIEGEFA